MPEQQQTIEPATHAPGGAPLDPEWVDEEAPEALPARPRRRLLAPLPVALAVVLMTTAGFIGGVLVEKGQGSSSAGAGGASSALAGRLSALRSGGAAGAASTGATGGGGGGGATLGQVSFVQGNTLYVTEAQGNTIKVTASSATSVTKSAKSSVAGIHPGETVVITGTGSANGAVTAEAIRAGEAGGAGGGLGALLGGGGAARGGAGASSSSGGGSGGESSLFGKGG